MWCGHVEYSPPFFLLREDWHLGSIEWLGSKMMCRPGMAEGRDTLKGAPAAAAAGRGARQVPLRECTSSQWPSEPELWPCTTLYRCGKTASLSTDLCSSSVRTTSWENTPKRSPNGHILLNPLSEYPGASDCRYSALECGIRSPENVLKHESHCRWFNDSYEEKHERASAWFARGCLIRIFPGVYLSSYLGGKINLVYFWCACVIGVLRTVRARGERCCVTVTGGAVARRGLLMSACAVSPLGLIREKAMVKRRGGEVRGGGKPPFPIF